MPLSVGREQQRNKPRRPVVQEDELSVALPFPLEAISQEVIVVIIVVINVKLRRDYEDIRRRLARIWK